MTVRGALPIALTLSLLGAGPTAETPAPTVVEVVITEGTNMAASLSPDGGTFAIDLLGRIWSLPRAGGVATPLTDPFGDARAPTWSPDGRRVAFQAYWAGDYDIWTIGADGTGLEQLTSGPFDDREPHWAPDGSKVTFSSDRAGTYDVWEVDIATGATRQLTDGPDNEYGPAYAPDSRRIAYVTDGAEGGVWTKNGSAPPTRVAELSGAQGFAPSWSPDGSSLLFNRLSTGVSELVVVSTAPGGAEESVVSDSGQDVFPFRASWADDRAFFYTADGAIQAGDTSGEAGRGVPFEATVVLDRPTYRKALRSFEAEGPRPVRGIVSPALSPDGTTVAFSALGDLWTMEIGSEPVRLTDDSWTEADVMWSPDGGQIVFTSDRDGSTNLWLRDVATGSERRLTVDGGSNGVWSPDGSEIAFTGGQGPDAGLRVVDAGSGAVRTVRRGLNNPGRPSWSPDGRSVAVSALWTYSTRFREGVNRALLVPATAPISQDLDDTFGGDGSLAVPALAGDVDVLPAPTLQSAERWLDFMPHGSVMSRGTDGPVWSPDGGTIAFVSAGVLWTVRVSPDGEALGAPSRINNELSADPTWSGDSRSILYLTTDRLRRVWLDDGRVEDVPVPLAYEAVTPTGRVVVHAGALFDGVEEELRRDVDIVIDGNRITRVVDHDPALHEGEVVDASDGVVSPGLIEMHTHGSLAGAESVGRQWLSYGVTTVRTPSADPYEMVEARESFATQRRIAPRLFGTGSTIDGSRIYYGGAPALSSSGQVELIMERAADLDFDLIKTYVRLSDAVQRRVIEDAHALGMPVTSHELYPGVAFGADGVEHVRGTSRRGYSTKVTQLNRSYQDVVELLASSGMTITPTVGIYGGYDLVGQEDPTLFDDPRIPVFIGDGARRGGRGGDPEIRRRMVSDMASLGRKVLERGGVVVVGTDSPIIPQGLSLIAEMQALVEYGGMRPVDVMRGTTSVSAEAMGYGQDLGAVRPGMLADLIVLGADPLTDIRAVRDVRVVIGDGRVYPLPTLLRSPAP